MFVIVVGGGKVGSHLAKVLSEKGEQVTLIEVDEARCELIAPEMKAIGVRLICGDGDEPAVLEDAGIRGAGAVVAATGHDEDNLVVTLLGKNEYGVDCTIARVNNPRNEWLFGERFGVDQKVCNSQAMIELLGGCIP